MVRVLDNLLKGSIRYLVLSQYTGLDLKSQQTLPLIDYKSRKYHGSIRDDRLFFCLLPTAYSWVLQSCFYHWRTIFLTSHVQTLNLNTCTERESANNGSVSERHGKSSYHLVKTLTFLLLFLHKNFSVTKSFILTDISSKWSEKEGADKLSQHLHPKRYYVYPKKCILLVTFMNKNLLKLKFT